MKILIIGADGQLGTDLCKVVPKKEQVPLIIRDIDITDKEKTFQVIKEHSPDIVVNTAAYNDVNRAEIEEGAAFAVNAEGARNVALACKEVGAVLVHISTDYVFDGTKDAPYLESDEPKPLSAYGRSKLAGENYVKQTLNEYFIVRTSGLYGKAGCMGKGGTNFVEKVLDRSKTDNLLLVATYEKLSPTYALDLAKKINELLHRNEYGVYHITNNGECSWHEFAVKIFQLLNKEIKIESVQADDFVVAKRPKNSVLKNANLAKIGLDDMRPWQEALKAYLAEKKYL